MAQLPLDYALVYNNETDLFSVVFYSEWENSPSGCVLFTSNNREELQAEADERNVGIGNEDYELTEENDMFIRTHFVQDMLDSPEDFGLI